MTAHVHLADETHPADGEAGRGVPGCVERGGRGDLLRRHLSPCGQSLPPEQLAQAQAKFVIAKENRKQEAVSRSQEYKKTLEQTQARREQYMRRRWRRRTRRPA